MRNSDTQVTAAVRGAMPAHEQVSRPGPLSRSVIAQEAQGSVR